MSGNLVDPLLVLLRRHEVADEVFDAAADRDAPEDERTICLLGAGERCTRSSTVHLLRRLRKVLRRRYSRSV
jgi:hypothetical protein